MNINRHNYEAFFLLYVDNELSAADRKAVEEFVAANPDLKPELDLFLETSLPGINIPFPEKQSLLKPEPVSEEQMTGMLMLLDNELNTNDAAKLRASIQNDMSLQTEWDILQQTRLDTNDTIIFNDKKSLYRHEEGKLVSMRIWRIAIAAAVIGVGFFVGFSVLQYNKTEVPDMVSSKPATNPASGPAINPSTDRPANNGDHANNGKEQGSLAVSVDMIKNKKMNTGIDDKPAQPARNALATNNTVINPADNSSSEKNNSLQSNLRLATNVEPKKNDMAADPEKDLQIAATNRLVQPKDIKPLTALDTDIMQTNTLQDVRTAALDINDDERSDNQILFASEETVKRSKLGGMLRKVKRTIERNANIKNGNGIQIAGFEIAAK